ncbi:hypothetical protein T05_64 [Trichinella murrelli]|uniref:Uncharacterized protein n=1 Tax=Trichinella murrelli TaxID=144512 RepID=A0A0V0T5L4_9BILA|nr:hypothetical protein T05_64 [Trichinella murrelli]
MPGYGSHVHACASSCYTSTSSWEVCPQTANVGCTAENHRSVRAAAGPAVFDPIQRTGDGRPPMQGTPSGRILLVFTSDGGCFLINAGVVCLLPVAVNDQASPRSSDILDAVRLDANLLQHA